MEMGVPSATQKGVCTLGDSWARRRGVASHRGLPVSPWEAQSSLHPSFSAPCPVAGSLPRNGRRPSPGERSRSSGRSSS